MEHCYLDGLDATRVIVLIGGKFKYAFDSVSLFRGIWHSIMEQRESALSSGVFTDLVATVS